METGMNYADVRVAIFNALETLGNEVYWGWTAPKDAERPYITMSFTGEVPSINIPCGKFAQLEVLVFGEEANILQIDPIADAIIDLLDKQVLDTPSGGNVRPEYRRDSRGDWWDEESRSNVIRISFWIPAT